MMPLLIDSIFRSICSAVMPLSVPATLKSMSPRWSSSPRMSDSTAKRLPSLMRPMAMPATCALTGTPASMSARLPPHTEAIDEEPFDSVISGHHADRVAELLLRRQQADQRALGEAAVADLAALRRSHAAGLAGGVRRHVVVDHEALAVLARERVDDLLVAAGAERHGDQRLGLAAGEQAPSRACAAARRRAR